MIKRFRNWCAVVPLVLALGTANGARADIEVLVTDGAHTGTANDTATPGSAAFSGTIGNFDVAIAQGTGFPAVLAVQEVGARTTIPRR